MRIPDSDLLRHWNDIEGAERTLVTSRQHLLAVLERSGQNIGHGDSRYRDLDQALVVQFEQAPEGGRKLRPAIEHVDQRRRVRHHEVAAAQPAPQPVGRDSRHNSLVHRALGKRPLLARNHVNSTRRAIPRTPAAVVDKINRDIQTVLKTPEVKSRLEDMGFKVTGSAPSELAASLKVERPRYAQAIQTAGIALR